MAMYVRISVIVAGLGLWATASHADNSGLRTCLDACARAKLSETNKATCRLDCETEAASNPENIKPPPQPSPPQPHKKHPPPRTTPTTPASPATPGTCKAGCDANRSLSVDDRATCKLECDLLASQGIAAPATPPPTTPGPTTPPPTTPGPTTITTPATPRPPALAPTAGTPPGFLDRCYASCQRGRSIRAETNFETCRLDCDTLTSVLDTASGWFPVLASGGTQPPAAPPPAVASPPVLPNVPTKPAPPPASPSKPEASVPATTPGPARDTCDLQLEQCQSNCDASRTRCSTACNRSSSVATDRETCKLGCDAERETCRGECLGVLVRCHNSRPAR